MAYASRFVSFTEVGTYSGPESRVGVSCAPAIVSCARACEAPEVLEGTVVSVPFVVSTAEPVLLSTVVVGSDGVEVGFTTADFLTVKVLAVLVACCLFAATFDRI